MRLDELYDQECTKLEMQVKSGQMTLSGAVARAFILGMNYQRECNEETARLQAEDAALEAKGNA